MKAEQVKTTQDALDLDEQEWERFIEQQAFHDGEPDRNGHHLIDFQNMKRQEVLKSIGWY